MPQFVSQRALYEVRERPAKTYSWVVFMLSNIIVELPWNTLASVILFFTWVSLDLGSRRRDRTSLLVPTNERFSPRV